MPSVTAAALLVVVIMSAAGSFGQKAADWDYNPGVSNGPAAWGSMAAYPDCKKQAQSPINFAGLTSVDATLQPLQLNWPPLTSYNVTVSGTTAKLLPLDNYAGTIVDPATGAGYKLVDMHFHSAGEHGFGGSLRDLELHMVHSLVSGTSKFPYMVVGLTFNAVPSGFNADLAPLFSVLVKANAAGGRTTNPINLTNLVPPVAAYFTYEGSLTLPPCTEGVKWYVMSEPLVVSQAMLKAVRDVMGVNSWNWTKNGVSEFMVPGNYRPVQPLNGRSVRLFAPAPPTAAMQPMVSAHDDSKLNHAAETANIAAAIAAIALVISIGLVVRGLMQNVEKPKAQPYADADRITAA
jgi:carbonic anhydrase